MSSDATARTMLAVAKRDAKSLSNMCNAAQHEEEVFGFHAQQAVEKALKAWIGFLGGDYPRTHDLSHLLHLLTLKDERAGEYLSLVRYTVYAVQMRYDLRNDADEPLNRAGVVKEVQGLIEVVERVGGETR